MDNTRRTSHDELDTKIAVNEVHGTYKGKSLNTL